MLRLTLVVLLMPVLQAQTTLQQLHDSYESFFRSRYSLEQEFPFRLISVRADLVPYRAEMDIRQPIVSNLQPIAELFKSFMPIMYDLVTASSHNPLTVTRQFMTRARRAVVDSGLRKWQQYLQRRGQQRITYRLLLAPYRKTDAELFYDRQKISMVRTGNLADSSLLWDQGRTEVQKHLSKEIDLLRAFLYYQYQRTNKHQPPRFLGAILTVDLEQRAIVLTTEVLVHLAPQQFPHRESRDGIVFSHINVPHGAKYRFPTARLRIRTIFDRHQQPPLLAIDFGNFSHIENFSFVINEQDNLNYTPHLVGKVAKFKSLTVNFQFQRLLLSLATMQSEEVKMVFSPAFKIGSMLNARLGNFKISKIDRRFQTEINEQLRQRLDPEKNVNHQLIKVFNDQQTAKFVSNNLVIAVKKLLSTQSR